MYRFGLGVLMRMVIHTIDPYRSTLERMFHRTYSDVLNADARIPHMVHRPVQSVPCQYPDRDQIPFRPPPMETEGSPEDKLSVTEHPK